MLDKYRYIYEPPKGFTAPHTWGVDGDLNQKIIQAIVAEMALWQQMGYTFRFGIEQEYQYRRIEVMEVGVNGVTSGSSVITRQRLEQKRVEALEGVVQPATIEMIQKFNPAELARFELEKSCLGATTTKLGGYYDTRYPDQVMEIAFVPADPLEAINNFHMVLSTMSDVNKSMGLPQPSMYKTDVSFSVWQHGNNLSDIQNRDPRALAIMDGLMRYIYDAAPIFMRKHRIDRYLSFQNIDTGPIRAASVRQADGRSEIRLDNNPTAGEHIASTILAIMRSVRFGFMLHGIESENLGTIPDGHPALMPTDPYYTTQSRFGSKRLFEPINQSDDSAFYTLEVLNGAKINEDGYLRPNTKHLFIYGINRPHICRELEIRGDADISSWFSKIKIIGTEIAWPPLDEITDKLEAVRAKLSNIRFGRESTVIKSEGYEVNPDYERFDNHMMKSHTNFMRASPNLALTYEPELLAELSGGLLNQGKSPSRVVQ